MIQQANRPAGRQAGSAARTMLRATAILIAIASMFDPVFSKVETDPRPIVAVSMTSTSGGDAIAALRNALPDQPVIVRDVVAGRLPCAIDEDCILVADGTVDAEWSARFRPVSMITIPIGDGPNVRLRSVAVAGGHRAAAGALRVDLEGRGVEGRRTQVRVLDGAAVVGSSEHEWSKAGTAALDVPWWPLDVGARALRIEAVPIDGEITTSDNQIDVGASVASGRASVLVFDARPSWQSTFVRRALEEDARFTVGYRSRLAPALTAGTANGRLDAATLDRVPLVIVGGPDALTATDVDLLDRYARIRGGTVLLLPERRPGGAVARLFEGAWTEHLSATPEPIGYVRAGEVLRASGLSPAAGVIASSGASPVIVSTPTGAGRIVVSGAIDAWRYRTGEFDRFWRSLAAHGAAAGEGLTLTFDNALLARGNRMRFTIRDRRMASVPSSEASAVRRCGDGPAETVRVWPRGTGSEFTGDVSSAAGGSCTIEARVGDRQVSASFAVADRPSHGIDRTLAKLERLARASGGVAVDAGDETAIVSTIAAGRQAMSRNVSAYPMRATWWLLPFVACLSLEWWLRRRDGLR
jgi:hypothetical protein